MQHEWVLSQSIGNAVPVGDVELLSEWELCPCLRLKSTATVPRYVK